MKFGRFQTKELRGALLAHSIRTRDISFKKGRLLSQEDVSRLRDAGIKEAVAAVLELGDVPEDVAAAAVPGFGLEGANTVLLGALTISGPTSRFTPELCEKISAPLLLEGKSLSACFGANLDWQKSEAR